MHLKHPDWDIALVFFTRSLYDSFIAQVDKWLRHFSNGETCYDEIVKEKSKFCMLGEQKIVKVLSFSM